jgi:hypothetical protein
MLLAASSNALRASSTLARWAIMSSRPLTRPLAMNWAV